jgi:hypothetical protein
MPNDSRGNSAEFQWHHRSNHELLGKADKARMPEMLVKTTWAAIKADLEKLVSRHLRA